MTVEHLDAVDIDGQPLAEICRLQQSTVGSFSACRDWLLWIDSRLGRDIPFTQQKAWASPPGLLH